MERSRSSAEVMRRSSKSSLYTSSHVSVSRSRDDSTMQPSSAPPIFTRQLEPLTVEENETAEFACQVSVSFFFSKICILTTFVQSKSHFASTDDEMCGNQISSPLQFSSQLLTIITKDQLLLYLCLSLGFDHLLYSVLLLLV